MSISTANIVTNRLQDMVLMADELKRLDIVQFAKEEKYVRICGESFRAVSLNDEYPLCGRDFNTKGSRNLDKVLSHFKEIENNWDSKKMDKKPERRLQCWIIKEALKNNKNMAGLLNLNDNFDELLFCLDEVSIGDSKRPLSSLLDLLPEGNKEKIDIVRCDILAVGRKGNEIYPVIIELKLAREKKVLEAQLSNFSAIINLFQDDFKTLLEKCSGKKITTMEPCKMLIWPELKPRLNDPGKTNVNMVTISELHKNNITVVEYIFKNDSEYIFHTYVSE